MVSTIDGTASWMIERNRFSLVSDTFKRDGSRARKQLAARNTADYPADEVVQDRESDGSLSCHLRSLALRPNQRSQLYG